MVAYAKEDGYNNLRKITKQLTSVIKGLTEERDKTNKKVEALEGRVDKVSKLLRG